MTLITHLENTKVICISESLPKNIENRESYTNIELEDYNGFHCNTGRGVSIYVKQDYKAEALNINTVFNDHIWVRIITEKQPVVIGCIYRSPNSPNENNEALLKLLEEVNSMNNTNLVIVGDFNYKEIDWCNKVVHARLEHHASRIYDKLNDLFLEQLIQKPTRYREGETQNVLDWVITNIKDYLVNLDLYPPLGEKGDHCIIKFDLDLTPDPMRYGDRFNYYKGDYTAMEEKLSNINWELLLEDKTAEEAWEIFASEITKLKLEHIPKRSTKIRKSQPWINRNVKESIKQKNKAWKEYQKDKYELHWENFKKIRNQTNRLVHESKHNFELKIAHEIKGNPKQFWNYVKAKNKSNNNFPAMSHEDIENITEDAKKADLFNSYFASVFTNENDIDIPSLQDRSEGKSLESVTITTEIIEKKLGNLNISKAAGPDNIHGKILKELKSQMSKPLQKIFNKSLNEGSLPKDWKFAHVKPLHKKGKRNLVSNYRPVSLTSICGKILERIIRDALILYLEENKLITDEQHGFRTGRSCTTQLLEIMEIWSDFIDRGLAIDCIYLDFAKAFDKVPHRRLINKLKAYGIRNGLINWIQNFLMDRNQVVVINNETSQVRPVTSGIPQGSVLGPILFIIYINDLPDIVNSCVKIFADDTKIFRTIQSEQDHDMLQQDLINLLEWSNKWKLNFNIEKCKILHYGNRNPNFEYLMNQIILKEEFQEKDLGVTFDVSLKFSIHVKNIVSKANSRVGIIKRNFTCMEMEIFLPLYKALVRPLLEYCSCIWNPMLKSDAVEIEKVQRRATKLVPGIANLTYSERLRHLKLDSLSFRRRRMDIIQVFRIIKQIDKIDPDKFFEMNTLSRTRGHSLKIVKPRAAHNLRNNSFTLRVINDWNGLKESTVNCTTINSFKSHLALEWENHPERFLDD